ncbi:CehA/McbA family metallohydrolase [Streptomyces sp. NPDC048603]|uniref:CehA/McbA family metallohydrolase n=1 Tax=Streptomyces sp. NPDC048603 TaxID=3365577 RepID=UPI00371557A2
MNDPLRTGHPRPPAREGPDRRDVLRLGTLLAAGGLAALVPADITYAVTAGEPGRTVTTVYRGHSPFGFDQWASVGFDVPAGVRRISVSSSFDPAKSPSIPGTWSNMLDIGVFGPTGFRGWSGGARRDFTLSASDATPGYLPGPVQPGKWSVALGPMASDPGGMGWEVRVTLEYGEPLPAAAPYDLLPAAVAGRGAGWYRGDLHLHTEHSDGQRTVDRLVADARAAGLHFIATSDHNTSATGVSWRGNVPGDLLVVNAEEVTTRHGHWLAVGIPQGEWVDWHYGPSDGVFDRHVRRVHSLGGLVIAAHPMTPGAGSFWTFGLDAVDAMEIWNGPWTLDDEANVALWHARLCLGKRLAGVGNSDAHAPGDAVGRPHNVVRAGALSTTALLDSLRVGRSYAVESSAVTVDLTASANGATAGPGEELPLGFFDAVDVDVRVSGAPNTVALLHTEWGVMAAAWIGAGGSAHLHWRGWGKASLFARAEVRRLEPAWTVPNQMVAVTNPVWFYGRQLPPYPIEQRTLFLAGRAADGSWSGTRPLPGAGGSVSFDGVQADVAGMPDGTVLVLGIGTDGGLWCMTASRTGGTVQAWQRLAGPDGAPAFTVRDAAVTGLRDGTGQILAIGSDNTLYHQQRRADGTLTGFRPVPGNGGAARWGATKASIAGMPDGSAQVVAYGSDGAAYHCVREARGTWSAWGRLGGAHGAAAFSGPALRITALPDGSSQVLAIGLDGVVYHQVRHPNGAWDGFRPPTGVTTAVMGASSVDIAGMPDGTAQVVAVGLDGNAWHRIRHRDGWTAWGQIKGPNGRDPFPAQQIRITGLSDGTARVVGISAGQGTTAATAGTATAAARPALPAFRLRNRRSGTVMGVDGMSRADGAGAVRSTDNGTGDHLWEPVDQGDGWYVLRNRHSGKVLGVDGMSTADGARVVQRTERGTADQLWRPVGGEGDAEGGANGGANGGWFRLRNRHSGKVLAVDGRSADGARIVQRTDGGSEDRLWLLHPDGPVRIENHGSGALLAPAAASGADAARVVGVVRSSGAGRDDDLLWTFLADADGLFGIRDARSGKALGVRAASSAGGARAVMYADDGPGAHRWRLLHGGAGCFRLVEARSGKMLVVDGASSADHAGSLRVTDDGGSGGGLWRMR